VAHPDSNRYLEQQVATASPAMLTAMLFDALVANSLRAADHLESGNAAIARRFLIRGQEIVLELRSSLNHELGGQLARNLDRLYEFVYHSLVEGSVRASAVPVLAAAKVASELRDGWREACVDNAVLVR
jgi:flagellar secretion chaperone FliS